MFLFIKSDELERWMCGWTKEDKIIFWDYLQQSRSMSNAATVKIITSLTDFEMWWSSNKKDKNLNKTQKKFISPHD